MTANSGLRSRQWFGATGRSGMAHRSWMRSQGFTPEVFDGRPVIGIATTWSELASCNVHLHRVAESGKRGVLQSCGFPREFPAMAWTAEAPATHLPTSPTRPAVDPRRYETAQRAGQAIVDLVRADLRPSA